MSHPKQGKSTGSTHDADFGLEEAEPTPRDGGPLSNVYARASKEQCLTRLALRIAGEISVPEAIDEAISSLRVLLPDCEIDVGNGKEQRRPLAKTCEWSLSEAEDAPRLTITLGPGHQPRDTARALELGEQVVCLLGAAMTRCGLVERLRDQQEETLELRRRIIQTDKLAGYGQLAASVLHDLNSPLMAILACTEHLGRVLPTKGIERADLERLSRIEEAAGMVLRKTRGLVEYACPPREPMGKVVLTDVLRRALALCEHELASARITVRTEFAEGLPATKGQAEHLTQLFMNLFTNAAHAARGTGDAELLVQASLGDDFRFVCVRVRDNGTGINPDDLEHIFDPFYTTHSGSGSGLGLSIVKDIVQYHGGEIAVQSEPHSGTTFVVLLPVALPE